MHLLDQYALSCGLKIDRPFIYTKYFPLGISKYITIQPFSNKWVKAKEYDYWEEVINYIYPALSKEGIKIVQVGGKEEKPLPNCVWTQGNTTVGQASFLIQNGMLHAGTDSFGIHVASAFNRKIVGLYSTSWIQNCGPYWSEPEDCILLEPDRTERKPSFQFVDSTSKNINEIKPEKIAQSILKLLGLDFVVNYETIFIGDFYTKFGIHTVPSSVSSLGKQMELQHLIIRMDLHFDEKNLIGQIQQQQTCSIITGKPIRLEVIEKFKSQIKDVVYIIDKNHDIEFVKGIHRAGVNYILMSYLSEEDLNKIKFKYLDYNFIFRKETPAKAKEKILNHPIDKLRYKSNKKILKEGKVYNSVPALKSDTPLKSLESSEFLPIEDTKEFWENLEDFYVIKKA